MTGSLSQTRGRPEPGRELDALIAERVMGIPIFNAADDGLPCVWIEEHTGESVAEYSTDIAAAFAVVEKMREDGWRCTLELLAEAESPYIFASFHARDQSAQNGHHAITPTTPLAICRAALAALSPADDGGAR